MAEDSKNSITGEVSVEFDPNKKNLEDLTGAKKLSKANDRPVQSQTVPQSTNNSAITNPVDKSSAIGYNTQDVLPSDNFDRSSTSSKGLPNKPGLDKKDSSPSDKEPSSSESSSQNYRESAPDIDKDYGNAPEPTNQSQSSEVSSNQDNPNQFPNNSTMPNQTPEQSLDDKKGLDDESKLNPEKSPEENDDNPNIDDNQKKDESELNPEAPNPNQSMGENSDNNQVNRQTPSIDDTNNKETPEQGQPQVGNGYGAIRTRQSTTQGANTDNAKKTFDHSNKMKSGTEEDSSSTKKEDKDQHDEKEKSKPSLKNPFSSLLNGRNKTSASKGNGKEDERKDNSFSSNMGFNSSSIIKFLMRNPMVLCALIVAIFFLFLLLVGLDSDLNGGGNGVCTYELNGILDSGPVTLEGVQVELVNCDAKSDNYTVLETIDFEKYVIGITVSEVGYESVNNPELYKSQIVAARNFALMRNRAMCPSHPDDCFYGYNPNTGKIRMRACTNDQVYCDIDKDCYRKTRGDEPALVGPEVHEGDAGAYVWKAKPSEELKEKLISVANEVKGAVLVDSSNQVVYTGYVDDDQQAWRAMANQGMKYDDILSTHFNVNGGHIYQANCTSGNIGNIDYGDYTLSSDGDTILHEPLETFLQKNGSSLEEFNALIAKNVDKAGYGTRAGTVAAAVTLIGELGDQFNVKVPYYWGGGHGDGIATGAKGNWGSTACHTYANNRSYDYCGLDCSGFVPWAINNGGFNVRQNLAGNFQNLSGARRVSLSNSAVLQPGDLLESSHHVVLVIGIDESSNSYICAEASGGAYGVLFTRRSFNLSGYWGVDMTGYYEANAKSK